MIGFNIARQKAHRMANSRLIRMAAALLAGACTTWAGAPSRGRVELQKLLRMPTVTVSFAFSFDANAGFRMTGDKQDDDDGGDVSVLLKKMHGNTSDAERYLSLSQLYGRMPGHEEEAKQALNRAIEFFRQRAEDEPENGKTLAAFGNALNAADRRDEAEHAFRQAVHTAPNEWVCWSSLGDFLLSKTVGKLTGGKLTNSATIGEIAIKSFENKPAVRLDEAEAALKEALQCYDKAVAAAPNEPQLYANRALTRMFGSGLKEIFRQLREGENDVNKVSVAFVKENAQGDFKKYIELKPDDYRAILTSIGFRVMGWLCRDGKYRPVQSTVWKELPEEIQQEVRVGITRLQDIGENPNKKTAAGAFDAKGNLEIMVMQDYASAGKSYRRAIALDPSREASWEMLCASLAELGNMEELRTVCESRVKLQNTSRNNLLLAKARWHLGQFAEAEEDARVALKLDSTNQTVQLAMAAALLKHDDATNWEEAGQHLIEARRLMGDSATDDDKKDFRLLYGLYLGLTGQTAEARKWFRESLADDPENEELKKAQAALGDDSNETK
jgi:tetratricopeptide (TPR) repeat protein